MATSNKQDYLEANVTYAIINNTRGTLVGPTVGGALRRVRDRQIYHAKKSWTWRVYLVGIGKVWRVGGV